MSQFPVLNRRQFMAGCTACGALATNAGLAAGLDAAALIPTDKAKVRLVFTHPDPERQGWPYQHYDYESRKKMYIARFQEACPEVEFLPATVRTKADAPAVLDRDNEVDGYLVYMLGIPSDANREFAMSGRPTLLVDDLYGGTGQFLGVYPQALDAGKPVAGVSSTSFEDVAEAANVFAAIKKLKRSTMLDVTDRDLSSAVSLFKESLGTTIKPVDIDEFNGAYEQANRDQGSEWAKRWTSAAKRVVEPSAKELEKSGAMYVGMRELLAKHKAQGIAVDCLRLFYGNKMKAYPCMGFFQLNNDGLVGACEADIQSATTMLLMTYLTGRPGYISDPVIDTSKNQIIYAHCVATNKVYGPQGPDNPFEIRDHTEDHNGAAVRSFMPVGEMTTTLKLVPAEKVLVMHRARTVDNIDEERACRTKLAAQPDDARALMKGWKYGWHRVTVYGDWRNRVETAAGLLGFRLVEEG